MSEPTPLPAWVIKPDGDSLIIDCNFQTMCRHCKNDSIFNCMKLFMVKFLKKNGNYAVELELRCSACGFSTPHDVDISKECYENGLKLVRKNENA